MKRAAIAFLLMMCAALPATAQPYPSAPFAPQPPISGVGPGFDPSNQAANLNYLVQAINEILSPLFPYTPGAMSFFAFTPGLPGDSPTLGVYGTAANVNLKVSPQGNGNIVLFPSTINENSTGLIKVGNIASWYPAPGLAACPGQLPGKSPVVWQGSISNTVTGYLLVKDWLDRVHAMPGC